MAHPHASSERWRQIEALFAEALDRPPTERAAFLDEACADTLALRAELDRLLDAHNQAAGFLDELDAARAAALLDDASEALDAGHVIGPYRLVRELGRGGMGVVYLAHDNRLDRPVALKFLTPHLSADEQAKRRFIEEARAASALDHPNIAVVHEIGETEEGQLFIAMAYYEGQTLRQQLEGGPLPVEEAVEIAKHVAEGLAAAHAGGIVHRDVKPSNVIVTEQGVAKIVDFGIAKARGVALTKTGATLGTVAYMSPEQTRGRSVDARTDVWSLGVVLYEMLTGVRPFRGESDQTLIYAIRHDEPEPVASLRLEAPEGLIQVVEKLLQKDPAERYQRVEDLLPDLKAFRKETEAKPARARPASRRGPSQRKRIVVYTGVAGLVVLALLALLFLLPSQPASEDQKSIAVLPFENLNRNAEDDYFSDGITEDILTQLSKIADLRVISSAATKPYRGSDKSPRAIGGELQVATLLTGSVQRSGNQLRIRCELIDVQTEAQIWAETYDREMEDVFAIQSEVAQHIANTLQAQLSPEEQERLAQQPTANLTAYQYYLKGRDYYYRYTTRDNDSAIELFKKAIALDPGYALAWAGLGDAYAMRPMRFGFAVSWLDSAIAVSRNALALDPNSAEAHKALSLAYLGKGWYDKSRAEVHKAVDLNPNYYPALIIIGYTYVSTGAIDEALPWLKKAVTLNPTGDFTYQVIGRAYRLLDDPVKAEQWLNEAADLNKDASYFRQLGLLYLVQGKDQLAADQIDQLLTHDPDHPFSLQYAGHLAGYVGNLSLAKQYYQQSLADMPLVETNLSNFWSVVGLGHVLWKEGQQAEAQELLGKSLDLRLRYIEQGGEDATVRYTIAALYAIQENKEEAYTWLQEAIDAGRREYRLSLRDPWLENLHEDERFRQMMAQVKAMVDAMRRRAEDNNW